LALCDYQCGAKAIDSLAWERVRGHLYESGFAWDVELLAVADAVGCSVREVPVAWTDMPGSTVDPIDTALELGSALLAVRHRTKRLKDDPLHSALAARRDDDVPLIDREGVDD
jgi:hypothetical protein